MKLFYWSERPNFGDELNPWLWSRLLPPGTINDDPSTWLVGIGTVLNHRVPKADKLLFFGTGYGYTNDIEVKILPNWKIYCLRGPLSTEALGLPLSMAIADPGILMRRFYQRTTVRYPMAYMPNESHMNESLVSVCGDLDLHVIDPTKPVDMVMEQLCATGTLITEALHGAVVGDALGIPYIPVCSPGILQFKWHDFAKSFGFDYEPLQISEIWPRPDKSVIGIVRNHAKKRLVATQLRRAIQTGTPRVTDRRLMEQKTCDLEARFEELKRDLRGSSAVSGTSR